MLVFTAEAMNWVYVGLQLINTFSAGKGVELKVKTFGGGLTCQHRRNCDYI